jgi:hypothetical protein
MLSVQFTELLSDASRAEFEQLVDTFNTLWLSEHNEDGTHIVDDPTTDVAAASAPYVTVGNTSGLSAERALIGTPDEVEITDNGANSTVQVGLVASPIVTGLTVSELTAGRVPIVSTGGLLADDADLTFATDTLTATKVVGSTSVVSPTVEATSQLLVGGITGTSTTVHAFTKKVTGIADNVATDVLTITVPNASHAAALRLMFISSNGGADAFESSRAAQGMVAFQRTTGVVATAAADTLSQNVIATGGGGAATHTFAYAVSTVTGAAGDSNSFTVTVTINDSGGSGDNQVAVFVELLNAETSGITIA